MSHLIDSILLDFQSLLSESERKVKSLSRVRLFATPWTVAHQVPPSMGFSRQEYWRGWPFPSPGDLPNPGIEPGSPTLQADALPSEPSGKPLLLLSYFLLSHFILFVKFLLYFDGESHFKQYFLIRVQGHPEVSYMSLLLDLIDFWGGIEFYVEILFPLKFEEFSLSPSI